MSTLKVNTIQNISGRERYLADAWVNFNGSGTVAIRGSGNVSSITDNGTGDYTINYATALADGDYCMTGTAQNDANGTSGGERNVAISASTGLTASAARVIVKDGAGSSADSIRVCVAVVR